MNREILFEVYENDFNVVKYKKIFYYLQLFLIIIGFMVSFYTKNIILPISIVFFVLSLVLKNHKYVKISIILGIIFITFTPLKYFLMIDEKTIFEIASTIIYGMFSMIIFKICIKKILEK